MHELLNQSRRVAEEVIGQCSVTRRAIVDGYDPANYAIRVRLQPEDILTDWIALQSPWVGNGWGLFAPPSIGDEIEITYSETDGGVGSAGWRVFNDEDRPLTVQSGEFWLVHETGTAFKLTNDGAATIEDAHGAMIRVKGNGTIESAGNWTHSGTFTANGISLTTHTHSGVQTGTGNSGGAQ